MWTASYNIPGYLPEGDVREFDTFDDAKRYIIKEILYYQHFYADVEPSEAVAEQLTHLAEDVNLESGPAFEAYGADGFVYWVMETE